MKTLRWCCLVCLVLVPILQSALAVPLLEVEHQRMIKSRFCRVYGCVFLQKLGPESSNMVLDQYLYRLRNGLFFVVTRRTQASDDLRLREVITVSLETYSTPKYLRRLAAFLPEFVAWAVPGKRVPFKFDFWKKCAVAEQFTQIVLGDLPDTRYQMVMPPGKQKLVVDCSFTTRPKGILAVALYSGDLTDWKEHLPVFYCGFVPQFPCRHF
jgi:hypothetical protein